MAARVFPTYLRFIDEVNHNAKVSKWIKDHIKKDIPRFASKVELYEYVNESLGKSPCMDYLEFGVHRGNSIRNWLNINSDPNSRFIGFDSFEGLPEAWNAVNQAGKFDVNGEIPTIDHPRVRFVKGWFQRTLRAELMNFVLRSNLVIHNDSDLHSSTLFVLSVLDTMIVPGTIVIFDEFSSPVHEFRAFHDYLAAYMRSAEAIGMTENYAAQVAFKFTN